MTYYHAGRCRNEKRCTPTDRNGFNIRVETWGSAKMHHPVQSGSKKQHNISLLQGSVGMEHTCACMHTSEDIKHHFIISGMSSERRARVQCCFTSTESLRSTETLTTIRDGEPRTATALQLCIRSALTYLQSCKRVQSIGLPWAFNRCCNYTVRLQGFVGWLA